MPKLLLCSFILLFHVFSSEAQYISFDELLSLRAKELDEVNDILIRKKWTMDNAKEGDYLDYNHATWAYNKDNYNSKARAWFHYYYMDGATNVVRYLTTSNTNHDLLKTRIKALGFKLTSKAIEDNSLAFVYSSGQRSVKVTTDTDEEGTPRFVFTVFKTANAASFNSVSSSSSKNAFSKTTITDFDGNIYKTTSIGSQTWMAENLKTTKYNDGTPITLLTSGAVWASNDNNKPMMCYYDNSETNKQKYGALYNWHVVNTGKLCPRGWHVPTDEEWTTLADYLGGESVAGIKLKASSGWNSDGNGTNEVGFTALPGGYRDYDNGTFYKLGSSGYWWSASANDTDNAWERGMDNGNGYFYRYYYNQEDGLSVRCLMD